MSDGIPEKKSTSVYSKEMEKLMEGEFKDCDSPLEEFLSEKMFESWMNGFNFEQLVDHYRAQNVNVSFKTLYATAKHYNWGDKRDRVLRQFKTQTEESILMSKQKFLAKYAMMNRMDYEKVRRTYEKFEKDPDAFFADKDELKEAYWLNNDLFHLKEFSKLMDEIMAGPVLPEDAQGSPGQGNQTFVGINIQNTQTAINDSDVRQKMVGLLKEAADSRHVDMLAMNVAPKSMTAESQKKEEKAALEMKKKEDEPKLEGLSKNGDLFEIEE